MLPAPKITSNRYLIQKFLHENIRKSVHQFKSPKILDVGCGKKPYRRYFVDSQLYIGVDKHAQEADVVAVAEELPFRGGCFDIVLCIQVLEHVENPKRVLEEIKRVLRPNGVVVLSTHGFWIEDHEIPDYWRWTFQGLAKILDECGFKIVKHVSTEPVTSFFQTVLLFIPQKPLFVPLIICTNVIAAFFKRILKTRGPKFHTVHVVIAKLKKEEK